MSILYATMTAYLFKVTTFETELFMSC